MPFLKATTSEQTTLPANAFGRDEMNLAEMPLTLLTDTAKPGQKTLYFEDPHGRLTVTGSDAYGLPTARDADVIIALVALTKKQNNFSDAKVNFTKYELLKLLGWSDEGDSYKRLDQSFNRWSGVLLVYDKCWWDNKRRKYVSVKMHIIESVVFIDSDGKHSGGSDELPLSTFTWSPTFIESCQAGNLRLLDLEAYRSLKSALAKQLYRFLGKRFYKQSEWTFDLKELAFERVGMSRSYTDAGKIKEKLQPALNELEAIGFLAPMDKSERFRKIEKGHWTIRLSQQPTTPLPSLVAKQPQAPNPLMEKLVNRGVSKSTASDLVAECQAEAIALKLEQFDFLISRNDPKVSKSPSGYLVTSIRDDYAAPKGFITQAEQSRREEVKQAKALVIAEEKRRKREADSVELAENVAADAYWQTLSPEQQRQIEEKVLAQAGDVARETYQAMRRLKAGAGYLAMLRRDYLRVQLKSGQITAPA